VGGTARGGRPIGVLLADDHAMFRQALAGVLVSRGDMKVVAGVPNDEDAPRLARQLRPDAMIMQVQMPFERAKRALKAMRSFPEPPKVVVVTMLESPRYVGGSWGWGPAPTCSRATPQST
jgi:DNA-binding NarL/FixJ family response regulator